MNISDLIEELEKHKNHNPKMDVDFVVSMTKHYCGSGEGLSDSSYRWSCYCSAEDVHFSIENISEKTEYDKKTKKHKTIGLSIRGYEI